MLLVLAGRTEEPYNLQCKHEWSRGEDEDPVKTFSQSQVGVWEFSSLIGCLFHRWGKLHQQAHHVSQAWNTGNLCFAFFCCCFYCSTQRKVFSHNTEQKIFGIILIVLGTQSKKKCFLKKMCKKGFWRRCYFVKDRHLGVAKAKKKTHWILKKSMTRVSKNVGSLAGFKVITTEKEPGSLLCFHL